MRQRRRDALLLLLLLLLFGTAPVHAQEPYDACPPLPPFLAPSDACAFIRRECTGSSLYAYLTLYYCAPVGATAAPAMRVLVSIMLMVWLLFLFSMLGLVASDFFCPNLSSIAIRWGLSDSVVGVTFLALGNAAPDVVSTFRAIEKDAATMAMGEIMGAAVFTVAIVCGSIMIFHTFALPPLLFLRDGGTYLLAVSLVLYFIQDGTLSMVDGVCMLALYIVYITTVLVGDVFHQPRHAAPCDDEEHAPLLSPHAESEADPVSATVPRGAHHSVLSAMRVHDMAMHSDAGLLMTPALAEHVMDPVSTARWQQTAQMRRIHSCMEAQAPADTCARDTARPPLPGHPAAHSEPEQLADDAAPPASLMRQVASMFASETPLTATRILTVALFPSLVHFAQQSAGSQAASVAYAPALFVLRLTVPLVSPDEFRLHSAMYELHAALSRDEGATRAIRASAWDDAVAVLETPGPFVPTRERVAADHLLMSVQCASVPLFVVWMDARLGWAAVAAVGVGGALAGTALWRHLRASPGRDEPAQLQRFLLFRSVLGFFMGLLWIVASVDGVLALLRACGYIYHWSEAILGLTVFALGNSLGDVVTNLSVAQLGHPLMAITACFASPLTNLLLGTGLATTWLTLTHPTHAPYTIALSPPLVLSCVVMLCMLVVMLVSVGMNGFKSSRTLGYVLLTTYACVMLANLALEFTNT